MPRKGRRTMRMRHALLMRFVMARK
ncbi:hypothetical protein E2C01_083889 [Portunus trituberculatus]|uniref:Uncharacterized protein n=1 Tax=Portunus trituberculatus TaxID=210409 RepID=A0A5B7IY92_PORTR|nr:hypothetical protein [Portunus trituberculatus]